MKTAVIKDLYSEIDRLKQGSSECTFLIYWNAKCHAFSTHLVSYLSAEVFAAREKNGIYIPRERYLQEEAEKKVYLNFPTKPSLDFFSFAHLLKSNFCTQAMTEKIEKLGVDLEARDKVSLSISML